MTLSPGAKLGPYEITAPVGQGGMGEVYQARDTRIDRTVALKVLGGTLSSVDHRTSLEREARFVASLNHPHICALHDVSREKETPFLVMEYVQGETLAARLTRGALPPREAIRYSIQIGEALDHAHRHGVLHRDLKPANIMLTKTGVKVLDFGLAALRTAAPIEVPLDRTPVAGAAADVGGVAARHHPVHGARASRGSRGRRRVGSVRVRRGHVRDGDRPARLRQRQCGGRHRRRAAERIRRQPSSIEPAVPATFEWVIQKAIAKNPDARWQAAGDIVEILRWVARTPDRAAAGAVLEAMAASRAGRALGGARAVSAFGAYRAFRAEPATEPSMMFSIYPPCDRGLHPDDVVGAEPAVCAVARRPPSRIRGLDRSRTVAALAPPAARAQPGATRRHPGRRVSLLVARQRSPSASSPTDR